MDFGETRDIDDKEILSSSSKYPEWMKNYLSSNSGKFCKISSIDTYGVFLGLSEDDLDYYYKLLTLDKNGDVITSYHSCCIGLEFIDSIGNTDTESKLLKSYEDREIKVEVYKITDIENAREFITTSLNNHKKSKIKNLLKLYMSEHSPMYTQIFIIKLHNIPSYVSTHFRTHKKNFIAETVTTNRVDRGGSKNAGRLTPVDMIIYCNSKTLVDMSLKRLCNHADSVARKIMSMIKNEVKKVDEDLYRFMVPQCIYRCGLCQEWESCGYVKTDKFRKELKSYLTGFENNCMNDLLNNVLNS